MKKFILKFLLLVIPFFLLWGILEYAGQKSGELKTVNEIIELQEQSEGELLIGMAYTGQQKFIDLYHVNTYKPECIALGTSRVMQFKGFCFQKGVSFYNTGGSVAENFDEYKNFLMNIDGDQLKMVILGLDSWIFNDEWNSTNCGDYSEYHELVYQSDINRKNIYHGMISDYLQGKWTLGKLIRNKDNIGMSGKVRNSGFMKDGSYYYGALYTHPETGDDYQFVDTFDRIENAGGRFEYGSEIDAETLDKLDDLLQYCYEREIQVAAFIPPYAPTVYTRMQETGNYTYLSKIYDACVPLFEKYDYSVYDYQDIQTHFTCSDAYFVDGFHGSEVLYAMMLADMASVDEKLAEYVDLSKIEELVVNKYSELVFEKPVQ